MPRVGRVTETGIQHSFASRVRRWLRVLREDLWTFGADPLPPSVWLRWLPHGVLSLVAFGVTIGAVAQLRDNGGAGAQVAFLIGLAQGGAVVLALWRPVAGWWLSTAAMVAGAVEVRRHLLAGGAHDFVWPWSAAGIIGQMAVMLLLALRVRARVSLETLALTVLVTYVIQGLWGARDYQPTGVLAITLFAVVVVLGMALRGRREARAELGRQTTITAEERARRTLLEERTNIARELHDVVAHHMSVISIQAQVAPHLVENPSQELKENLAGIRQNALDALTELRHVLGVLRSENREDPYGLGEPGTGAAPDAPQPMLDRLDALIENTRAAGLDVVTDIRGEAPQYATGVELSAYRIIQEALSNALRHAPGSEVRVEVSHDFHGLHLGVVNSRPQQPVPPSPGAGHGLLGMRERATMLGGHLTAAPTQHGGFAVSAFLPRGDTPPTAHP
ncbi:MULTISPECIES: histidine kinase [unclassified Streptomyces]|uniref:sensor histidine kinase n=1 Tax=unclassified Streptomyces TaxID=2593676 RepID=UPI002364FCAB|nr:MULTISPECIES: histidine kinase [unclassified Streptomyces]MDF3145781.1 histidine kinase [Streptomyces sp. T21Q-yed]WDF40065.1 histidine kinase [Streptomyces sp. T12]